MINFRHWVHNLWLDNCEERAVYSTGDRLTKQEYFRRFKWWLRREYRHQIHKQKEQNERKQHFRQWA